jgi:hypothetical protein
MTATKTRARKGSALENTSGFYSFLRPDAQGASPEAAREFATQAIERTRAGFEHYAVVAAETADLLAEGYKAAAQDLAAANLKMIDAARDHVKAAVDAARNLLSATSLSDAMEVQTAFVRERFNANLVQANDMALTARKVANDTAGPARELLQKSLQGWQQTA